MSIALLSELGKDARMQTQVDFVSPKFPAYDGEEDQINPGVWGKRLAEYLAQKLSENGVKTGEIIPEDWGWCVPVQIDSIKMAVCCGHQDGDDNEFVCFTEPSTPIKKQFFRKIDITSQLAHLLKTLALILEAEADIMEIQWSDPHHQK